MPRVHTGPRRRGGEISEHGGAPGWQGRLRLWIDIDGRNALGPGKVRLLQAIGAFKSLSAAAKALRMSYRLAWKHVQMIEQRTGLTVVTPRRGGTDGGGSELTPTGKALLEAYDSLHREVEEHMQSACSRHFARWSDRKTTETR